MKKLFFFLSALVLFACTHQTTEQTQQNTADTSTTVTEIITEEVQIEGLYVNQHITNCANDETISVVNTQSLDSAYKVLLPAAYNGLTLYVKVKGALTTKGANKELTVKQLIQAEQKNDHNTCIPYDYWGRGTEPFWILQISEKENLIDFYDPMAPKYYHFSYSKPIQTGKATVYTAEDKTANNTIKISVINEKCSDGMSERDYTRKIEVTLNGKLYKGCGVAFTDK